MSASIAHHTTGQMILDVPELKQPDVVTGSTIQERFEAFHDLNPWVLETLERLTSEYLEGGQRRIGIGMLFEVLRWQYGRVTRGDEFRLNNNYRSRYVRLLLAEHPEWEAVFHTRSLQSA
ncbi:hypothetical protein [Aeromicrobium sp. Leaf291]|uniref:hypothetical protein n=1 Tax=Aeromicrobium sp. Leaf291 TaxID=1736325 RepID=UPI0007021ADC|nr:hypothetical protein [Aeromicrobium sp. Leaf291]KQP81558.1 hypothetical protein ASF35_16130 [Aeromicrobium sp. Leaf291]